MKKYRVQLEYIDIKTRAIKINVFNNNNKTILKEYFDFDEDNFNAENIINKLIQFKSENHIEFYDRANVVVSSTKVHHTTITLPKSKKYKLFLENEIEDKFSEDYKSKNALFTNKVEFSNNGLIAYVSILPNILITELSKICKGIGVKLGDVTSISLLLAEKEEKNSTISKKEPHISIYLKNKYSVINVIFNGKIIDTYLSEFGYTKITELNVVERTKYIEKLNIQVMSLLNKHQLYFTNSEINNFYLYCKDQNLVKQFNNKIIQIPYKNIFDDEFSFDLFNVNKYTYKHPLFLKGFTLTEVLVSMSVFGIMSVIIISILLNLNSLSNKDYKTIIVGNCVDSFHSEFIAYPDNFINKLKTYDSKLDQNKYTIPLTAEGDFTLNSTGKTFYIALFTKEIIQNIDIDSSSFTKYETTLVFIKEFNSPNLIKENICFSTIK